MMAEAPPKGKSTATSTAATSSGHCPEATALTALPGATSRPEVTTGRHVVPLGCHGCLFPCDQTHCLQISALILVWGSTPTLISYPSHTTHRCVCSSTAPLSPSPPTSSTCLSALLPPHFSLSPCSPLTTPQPSAPSFLHSPCITITKRHSSRALHVHSRLLPVGGKVGNCYLHSWAKSSTSDHLGCREQAQRWPHRRSSPCLVQSSGLDARKAVLQPTTGNNNEHLFSALKTGCSPYVWQQVISLRGSFLQGRAVLVVLVQLGSLLGRVILQQHWELCICPNMLAYVYMEGDWK